MSVPLYSLLITAVGEYVENYLQEQRLILFSDAVPDDIASIAPYTRPAS
jgi:PTS system glucitol/sorbitol-specific IIA component